ncbi:MAG TPA: CbiX/SirB N-terminal domain-containing protein [Longimicrobiales bacterium]
MRGLYRTRSVRRIGRGAVALALLLTAAAGPAAAQGTGSATGHAHNGEHGGVPGTASGTGAEAPALVADSTVGTVVVAHGGSAEWNAPVLRIAAQAPTGGPVEVSFLMGDSAKAYRFQDAVARLAARGATRIVVVPLLASSHSGHYEQIRYLAGQTDSLPENMMHHLHMSGIERPRVGLPIHLTPALDASIEVARILADRARALAESPAEQALFIVGHGPNSAEDYAGWMRNLRPLADSVARWTGFRDVKLGLVRDDAPDPVREEAVRRIREIIALQHALTGRDVVVVPLLVSKGYISTRKLPADLRDLPIAYDAEGLLPHPELANWIARRVREATTQPPVSSAAGPSA